MFRDRTGTSLPGRLVYSVCSVWSFQSSKISVIYKCYPSRNGRYINFAAQHDDNFSHFTLQFAAQKLEKYFPGHSLYIGRAKLQSVAPTQYLTVAVENSNTDCQRDSVLYVQMQVLHVCSTNPHLHTGAAHHLIQM
jgi:hypothetical protein